MNAIALASVLFGGLAGSLSASDWLDNFDDGLFDDGMPVTWSPYPPLPASMTIEEGDLVLGVQVASGAFRVGAAFVPIEFPEGMSLRARMRGSQAPYWLGLNIPNPADIGQGYVAALESDGLLSLIRADSASEVSKLGGAQTDVNPSSDFLMQFDCFDGLLTVTVWRPGEAKPRPQLAVFDDSFPAGMGSVFVQDGGGPELTDATAHLRYAQASSTLLTHSDLGDLDVNGTVDGVDLVLLLGSWTGAGDCGAGVDLCFGDLNGDNHVDAADLVILLGGWT